MSRVFRSLFLYIAHLYALGEHGHLQGNTPPAVAKQFHNLNLPSQLFLYMYITDTIGKCSRNVGRRAFRL